MLLKTLANQLLHDLKANRAKSAVLAVLFIVGLYFWIPLLYRAVVGEPARDARQPAETGADTPARAARKPADPQPASMNREKAEEILRTDPLVQSADVEDLKDDPFELDYDQFSPPLLFAEEAAESDTDGPASNGPPSELVLKSTIIGRSQRSAFINQKLCREGTDFALDGQTYHLVAVHPRKVVLRRGGNVFELTIEERDSRGKVRVRRETSGR